MQASQKIEVEVLVCGDYDNNDHAKVAGELSLYIRVRNKNRMLIKLWGEQFIILETKENKYAHIYHKRDYHISTHAAALYLAVLFINKTPHRCV